MTRSDIWRTSMGQHHNGATARKHVVLSIVMAAYNEAETIEAAIQHVLGAAYPCEVELIVVDDGSTDGTADRIAHLADQRLTVLQHDRNRGKGAALITGLKVAKGTHLLPFDADLEYSAHDLSRMLEPVIAGLADVVYGTRLFGLNTVYHSFRYKMGNRATTLAANLLFDSAVTDIHTCLKLVPIDILRSFCLTENGFGLDSEITANVLRYGLRPFEVPVAYYARSHGEGKKINWRDGVRCLAVLTRVRLRPVATRPPVVTRLKPAADRVITLPDHGSPAKPGERISIRLGGQRTAAGLSLATGTE